MGFNSGFKGLIYVKHFMWENVGLPATCRSHKVMVKGKVHPRTGHEGPEGEKTYSPILSFASGLDGVCGQRHAPAAFLPVKTRYPSYRRLGGHQGQSGRVRKISPPHGFDPRTVQLVASRYTA